MLSSTYAQPQFSQNNWFSSNYYGIPEEERTVLFEDEFEDNRNQWDLRALNVNMRIQDDLYCESKAAQNVDRYLNVPLNELGNYELELRMRFVRGEDQNATGLTFGRDEQGSGYYFLFVPRGRYKIYKQDRSGRGEGQSIQGWQPSQEVIRYASNTLTVRKVESEWYFFINRELVARKPAQKFFGNNIGFVIGGNMSVEIDYLKVTEIHGTDNQGPTLDLYQPLLGDSQHAIFDDPNQIIKGRLMDPSGIASLMINDTPISINGDGTFSASIMLPKGSTLITLVARDNYQNLVRKAFYMTYPGPRPSTAGISPMAPEGPANGGKNYLLMIGIDTYSAWNDLHNAVRDCEDLAEELVYNYQFDKEHIVRLYNNKATRENILEAFEDLQARITENDNLLVYYAGHGYYDEQSERGYWVPTGARLSKIADFIRNSTIHDYVKSIDSRHTFLIADACYAGSLFANARGVYSPNARSRWAFTSGDIEKVWDGQPGQNSPFAQYLLRALRENRKQRLRADQLINEVKVAVSRNTAQTPQGLPLQNAGDEGGIFYFERRQTAYNR